MKYSLIVIFIIMLMPNLYSQNLQSTTPIAVLDLNSEGIPESHARLISARLRTELFRTKKFSVIEREKMQNILEEQGFQLSGCTSNDCAVEIGRMVGVRQMVAGHVGKIGVVITLDLRLIDVQSGRVINTATVDCMCKIEQVLLNSVKTAARILAGLSDQTYFDETDEADKDTKQETTSISKSNNNKRSTRRKTENNESSKEFYFPPIQTFKTEKPFYVSFWGGINRATFRLKNGGHREFESVGRFVLGLALEKKFSKSLSIELGAYYVEAGAKQGLWGWEPDVVKFDHNSSFAEIPLDLKWYTNISKSFNPYFLVGGFYGFLLDYKEETEVGEELSYTIYDMNSSNAGLDLGVGVIFVISEVMDFNFLAKYLRGFVPLDDSYSNYPMTDDIRFMIGFTIKNW